ncbi:hypothetical protein FIV34_04135 [Luteibacter pinisoli]|uniref:Uncharacterized protein n=1 Tax=Luteibacter pinisoli TaxID=2589080 RepID=A0A4Y5Z0T7_9GAMM|nr:hypothetical protein [Luteibacter pinisoli]QDE38446.1 hypothetical protein FIV34_04135 [Luteibacter pinisoli]
MRAGSSYQLGDALSPPDAAATRDLVNQVIRGRLRNGLEHGQVVTLRSRHDLGEAADAPGHSPGHRHFEVALRVSHPEPMVASVILGAYEPGSDYVRVPVGQLLGAVSALETNLGVIADIAKSICADASHAERREYRRSLREIERTENARADALRALAADPLTWPEISPQAFIYGRVLSAQREKEGA